MAQRLTYRRRHGYRTSSNKIRKVKTPGGKLVIHYRTKTTNQAKCGDCGGALAGLPSIRPKKLRTLKHREVTISRAYGGSRCGKCVRQRIVRAFLIEEQKIVKHVIRAQKKSQKKAESK